MGIAVLRAYVRALQDIGKRNAGEPVATPVLSIGVQSMQHHESETLREAIDGWEKERARPTGTVGEYKRAVEMFMQLHGDLPVAARRKSHARQFREALQDVPRTRAGKLKDASMPELVAWSHKHPNAPKVTAVVTRSVAVAAAVTLVVGWSNFGIVALYGHEARFPFLDLSDTQISVLNLLEPCALVVASAIVVITRSRLRRACPSDESYA